MRLEHEYIHHRLGYRFGTRCCWVRIYGGGPGDAPVVVCEEMPEFGVDVAEMSGHLAAEVVHEHFAGDLPDLPRPLLWIEHRPSRSRRGPGRFYLLTFPSYRPRPVMMGFVRPMTLGSPCRESITAEEVASLTGEETWYDR